MTAAAPLRLPNLTVVDKGLVDAMLDDGVRPIGTALVARLLKIIAAVAERSTCGGREGWVSP